MESFARVVVTAGLTSLTLGVIARGWSWVRHGPSRTVPPSDCPPRGARIAGLAVARRELGPFRAASVLVLVHDRGATGEAMLELVGELPGARVMLAPTGPMPVADGAGWIWANPSDAGFASAVASAAGGLAAFLREVRRCNPGRRLVAMGHGQGGHVLLTAAAFEPSLADELVLVGATLPAGVVPAALPATVMLHDLADPLVPAEDAAALAAELAGLGLPVRASQHEGNGALAGPLLAALLGALVNSKATKHG